MSRLSASTKSERWQDLVESMANPFKSPFEKPAIFQKLVENSSDIVASISAVASGKASIEEELLSTSAKGQVEALKAVRRQLIEDIIPENQRAIQGWISDPAKRNPQNIAKRLLNQLDDITSSGKLPMPPSPVEVINAVVEEGKNLFATTPDLETPEYKVVSTNNDYEIREYPSFTVCATTMNPKSGNSRSFSSSDGQAFTTLADYLFGKNTAQDAMSMTTPVITSIDDGDGALRMEFVLPAKYAARASGDLPRPLDPSVSVAVRPPSCWAARSFTGFATDGEVSLQLGKLEAALARDGAVVAGPQRQLLQYNPPWTLPTIRRNEVLVPVLRPAPPSPSPDVVGAAPQAPA